MDVGKKCEGKNLCHEPLFGCAVTETTLITNNSEDENAPEDKDIPFLMNNTNDEIEHKKSNLWPSN